MESACFASQGFAWGAYQINLEPTHFCQPELCWGGPNESTWNLHACASQGFAWEGLPNQLGNHTFANQGFAWEGLLNQLGIHCGPPLCILYNTVRDRGGPSWRTGTPYNAMLVILDGHQPRPRPIHFGYGFDGQHPGAAPPPLMGCKLLTRQIGSPGPQSESQWGSLKNRPRKGPQSQGGAA